MPWNDYPAGSITIPGNAGPSDPRIVITSNPPPGLPSGLVAVILFYWNATDGFYLGVSRNGNPNDGLMQQGVFVPSAGDQAVLDQLAYFGSGLQRNVQQQRRSPNFTNGELGLDQLYDDLERIANRIQIMRTHGFTPQLTGDGGLNIVGSFGTIDLDPGVDAFGAEYDLQMWSRSMPRGRVGQYNGIGVPVFGPISAPNMTALHVVNCALEPNRAYDVTIRAQLSTTTAANHVAWQVRRWPAATVLTDYGWYPVASGADRRYDQTDSFTTDASFVAGTYDLAIYLAAATGAGAAGIAVRGYPGGIYEVVVKDVGPASMYPGRPIY